MSYGNKAVFETAYEYLGVHREDTSYIFRVFAPRADAVYAAGDFNSWDESCPMTRTECGIWECSVCASSIREGDLYKYKIKNGSNELYKADPYSFYSKDASETASAVIGNFDHAWRDKGWLEYRRNNSANKPINIYKIHATSWRRHDNGKIYSWRELACELAPYVKQMGYTHVELMPIMEQADDSLFGYSIDSFYAPTARMGKPYELMDFIDSMHEAGIGVILDIIPSRFAKNSNSLADFDGQPLYEKEGDGAEGINGTKIFDIGRDEVKSFIISNANFWIDVYHADGLKLDIDSVKTFSKTEEGTELLRKLKASVKKRFPDVLLIDSCEDDSFDGLNGDGKLAFIKADLGYQITFPNKKALFMGTEIGQLWENERTPSVKWHLLDREPNVKLQYYTAELNHLYLREPLLQNDDLFENIETNDREVMACKRADGNGNELLIILNFNSGMRKKIRIGVSKKGSYKEIFNSDDLRFGGNGEVSFGLTESENIRCQNCSESVYFSVPPISLAIFKRVEKFS